MSLAPSRGVVFAGATAVLMHVLLFAVVQPSGGQRRAQTPVPPHTRYMPGPADDGIDESMVRTIKSPVVFSLPSEMGFSRELTDNDVQTRKSFLRQVRSEHFLEVAPSERRVGEHLHPERLMVSASRSGPRLPKDVHGPKEPRPAARRVSLPPELKTRLVGGIVLPVELNQAVEKPWEVQASVSISDQGTVEHVFLKQPLDSASLNQQVLQLLYGLRFKPGAPVEGRIEIYSPVAGTAEEPGK